MLKGTCKLCKYPVALDAGKWMHQGPSAVFGHSVALWTESMRLLSEVP